MVSQKEKARQRVDEEIAKLFTFARTKAKAHPEQAREAVKLAVRVAQKMRKRLPKQSKRSYCHKCFSYLLPGVSVTVRIDKSRVAYHCHHCKAIMRLPYRREQKSKA